jgi:hypothetical protein
MPVTGCIRNYPIKSFHSPFPTSTGWWILSCLGSLDLVQLAASFASTQCRKKQNRLRYMAQSISMDATQENNYDLFAYSTVNATSICQKSLKGLLMSLHIR